MREIRTIARDCRISGSVMRRSVEIKPSTAECSKLERLAWGQKVWRALSNRAHIVLLPAEGLTCGATNKMSSHPDRRVILTNVQINNTLSINNLTAKKWRNWFAEQGMNGLQDEPRPDGPRCIDECAEAELVGKTLGEKPRDATYWSARSMATRRAKRRQQSAAYGRPFCRVTNSHRAPAVTLQPHGAELGEATVGRPCGHGQWLVGAYALL